VKIPLEDNFHDILGKAFRGSGLTDEQLAQRAGLSAETVAAVTAPPSIALPRLSPS
jgi:ribosome-binding protein aMBF1 (putative translation factor)